MQMTGKEGISEKGNKMRSLLQKGVGGYDWGKEIERNKREKRESRRAGKIEKKERRGGNRRKKRVRNLLNHGILKPTALSDYGTGLWYDVFKLGNEKGQELNTGSSR